MGKMGKDDNYKTQRIDELTDTIHADLKADIKEVNDTVKEIRKTLIGNGGVGLIQQVTSNKTKIKIMMWIISVIFAAVVGSYFNKTITINRTEDLPSITIGTNEKK